MEPDRLGALRAAVMKRSAQHSSYLNDRDYAVSGATERSVDSTGVVAVKITTRTVLTSGPGRSVSTMDDSGGCREATRRLRPPRRLGL